MSNNHNLASSIFKKPFLFCRIYEFPMTEEEESVNLSPEYWLFGVLDRYVCSPYVCLCTECFNPNLLKSIYSTSDPGNRLCFLYCGCSRHQYFIVSLRYGSPYFPHRFAFPVIPFSCYPNFLVTIPHRPHGPSFIVTPHRP